MSFAESTENYSERSRFDGFVMVPLRDHVVMRSHNAFHAHFFVSDRASTAPRRTTTALPFGTGRVELKLIASKSLDYSVHVTTATKQQLVPHG